MFRTRSASHVAQSGFACIGLACAAAVVGAEGLPAAAQQRTPSQMLASAKSVSCRFTTRARVTWQKGVPTVAVEPSSLAMGFDEISADDGTARAIDRVGPSDIILRVTDGGLHFLHSFREGALYLTTIFPKETTDARLQAVHTRHEFTPVSVPGFTSSPEQYYGDCAITAASGL